jgi:F420H(2)-dependent quinone reductase
MAAMTERKPWLPPPLVIRAAWAAHRAIYSASGGRLGLRNGVGATMGMLRLRTIGRHSGEERRAILGYVQDGQNLVTAAMNGWMDPEPAWWLNLQAHPDATVDLEDGPHAVRGRIANPDERPRLWAALEQAGPFRNVDRYAARRSRETAVVILEPRSADAS